MALVDADYKFIYVNCGANGSGSDGGVFNATALREALEDGTIGLPPPEPIAGGDRPVPYFIVGDDAFPLRTWLMKPLPLRNMTKQQRIYNYRLSRARRIVENAFGILASKFRCLLTTIPQKTKTVVSLVFACFNHRLRISSAGFLTPTYVTVNPPASTSVSRVTWPMP